MTRGAEEKKKYFTGWEIRERLKPIMGGPVSVFGAHLGVSINNHFTVEIF